ncbi:MAG: 23S rRNA (uracil(1939)-C(5))-methyltransferase RlmD [Alphaproteobacteria bacterium]|nr:23S rRNA (uracil(1939)-C(5))-methyltransferase RlmD [Alphaproteobacteria bacterium]
MHRQKPHRPKKPDIRAFTPEGWTPRGEAWIPREKPTLAFGGIPGETGGYSLIHAGHNRTLVRWRDSRKPDPHRVEPPCERYDTCGGCPLMHVDAEGQRAAREGLVRAALAEAGVEVEAIAPEVGGALGDFRHVVKMAAGVSDQGRPRFGAPGRYIRRIVPIPECTVVTPELRGAMKAMAWAAIDRELHPFVPERGGTVRWLIARQSRATGEILVTVVATRSPRALREWAEQVARECSDVVGVHVHLNDGPGNAIFAPDGQGLVGTSRLLGADTITERLGQVELRLGPGDFFQTHPVIADRICADVVELARGAPAVDLYAGVGGFTLNLAKRSGWALGVEVNAGAVQRAREAARAQNIPAEFIAGEVAEVAPDLAKRLEGRRPVVIVDPARRGLEEGVIEAVHSLDPGRVLYVSCNPQALARDLARFTAEGWRVSELRPYNMFPNTAHVELLAALDPPGGQAPTSRRRGPRRVVVRG